MVSIQNYISQVSGLQTSPPDSQSFIFHMILWLQRKVRLFLKSSLVQHKDAHETTKRWKSTNMCHDLPIFTWFSLPNNLFGFISSLLQIISLSLCILPIFLNQASSQTYDWYHWWCQINILKNVGALISSYHCGQLNYHTICISYIEDIEERRNILSSFAGKYWF